MSEKSTKILCILSVFVIVMDRKPNLETAVSFRYRVMALPCIPNRNRNAETRNKASRSPKHTANF